MASPYSIFESQLKYCLLQEALLDLPLRSLSAPYPCSVLFLVLIISSHKPRHCAGRELVGPALRCVLYTQQAQSGCSANPYGLTTGPQASR